MNRLISVCYAHVHHLSSSPCVLNDYGIRCGQSFWLSVATIHVVVTHSKQQHKPDLQQNTMLCAMASNGSLFYFRGPVPMEGAKIGDECHFPCERFRTNALPRYSIVAWDDTLYAFRVLAPHWVEDSYIGSETVVQFMREHHARRLPARQPRSSDLNNATDLLLVIANYQHPFILQ